MDTNTAKQGDKQPNTNERRQRFLKHFRRGGPGRQLQPGEREFGTLQVANLGRLQALDARIAGTEGASLPKNLKQALAKAAQARQAATGRGDYTAALKALQDQVRIADQFDLLANARLKGRQEGVKQLQVQKDLHAELAPVLGKVRAASFTAGMADNIAAGDKGGSPTFDEYLTALRAVEQAKAGVDRNKPTPKADIAAQRKLIATLLQKAKACQEDILAVHGDAPKDKAAANRKRVCAEGVLMARQFLLALDLDELGAAPQDGAPWSAETETRAASLRAKLNFHQAYQEAGTLGQGGDTAGASESRWLQGVDFVEKDKSDGSGKAWDVQKNKRVAIFKPMIGEQPPDGASDEAGAGAAKEALAYANAKLIAQQTGIDLKVPPTHVVSVGRYALRDGGPGLANGGNLDEDVVGSSQNNAGGGTDMKSMPLDQRDFPKDEVHKMMLLDLVSLSVDRHGGNVMVQDDNGTKRLVPIDHGGTLPKRADFDTVVGRFAGLGHSATGVSPVNAMLRQPSAFEPFTPEMQAQLQLLDPGAIEQGMKDQRDVLDTVHPGLGAGAKIEDESLKMSKRAMLFTQRAALAPLSPAVIQIALGQHGKALFDADDPTFEVLADQVIAGMLGQQDAYREFFLLPGDTCAEVLRWLEQAKWVVPHPTADAAETFAMANPKLALELYRAGKVNPNPPEMNRKRDPIKPMPDDANGGGLTAADEPQLLQLINQSMPEISKRYAENPQHAMFNAQWGKTKHFWNELMTNGGAAAYRRALQATGFPETVSLEDAAKAARLWNQLNDPQNRAALANLRPVPSIKSLVPTLERWLTTLHCERQAQAVAQSATQERAQLTDQGIEQGALAKVAARLDKVGQGHAAVAGVAALVQQGKTLAANNPQQLAFEPLMAQLLELERSLTLVVLTDILQRVRMAEADIKAEPFIPYLPDNERNALNIMIGNALGSAQEKLSPRLAEEALFNLGAHVAELRKVYAAKPSLPKFSWDAKVLSAIKKQAVNAGMIKDKDTGMSDAVKSVLSARKDFDDTVASSKSSPDKRRTAGAKAVAAYEKFDGFVRDKLRPLSTEMAWLIYCDGAASAVAAEIKAVKAQS